jgi:hypothetical protein
LRASEAAYKKSKEASTAIRAINAARITPDQLGQIPTTSSLTKLPSWPINDVAALSPLKLKILTKIPGSFVVKYSRWEPGA